MSRLAILVLCVQACLIQTVISQQCGCNQISYGPSGLYEVDYEKYAVNAPSSISVSQTSSSLNRPSIGVGAPSYAQYGGKGTGQVGVSGDIGASGQTVVVGSVPVLGSVEFGGRVSAAGSVSISGQCGCGCS